jgi:hypothetical protein
MSQQNFQSQAIRAGVVLGTVAATYFLGRKIIKGINERRTALLADKSPEVQQAMTLRSAMNPSGVSWLMWSDGTNEKVILDTADLITNFSAVTTAYRNLYQSELMKDLQSELSTVDFNAFLQKMSSGNANNSTPTTQPKTAYSQTGAMVVAKQAVYVRTSPDASYHGAWYEVGENQNIHHSAVAGEFLGYATGRQSYDAVNGVKFIEIGYKRGSMTTILWVSASSSYTEQFTSRKALVARYPQAAAMLDLMQPIAFVGWSGVSGSPLVTATATRAYDEGSQPTDWIGKGTLVGFPVMTLSGNGNEMTLVRTISGQERWMKTNHLMQL